MTDTADRGAAGVEPPEDEIAGNGLTDEIRRRIAPHFIKAQGGKRYLTVQGRLIWFREVRPEWGIRTESVALDLEAGYAVFRAEVSNEQGRVIATATKQEDRKGFPDFMEKAETGSIGRALLLCGYGTAFADELDEGQRLADSPSPVRPYQGQGQGFNGGGSSRPQSSPGAASRAYQGQNGYGSRPDGIAPCAACGGAMVSAGQVAFTEKKFGRPLCSNCQKAAQETA